MTASQLTVFPPELTLTASPTRRIAPADQPDLPNGWQWVKLSDAVTLSSEKYQPTGASEYYVGLEHIEKGTGRISERAQAEPISTVKNSFRAGEILYGKLRPYLNKVALAVRDGVCSTDILVLQPEETVVAKYVHYFILRDKFVNDMSANSMGVNLPRVPTKYVLGYSFPLPPLAEQQLIVAKIEELFSEIDAGTREVETALQRLKIYRQAVLHHFLNNNAWERVKLVEVVEKVQIGPFGTQLHQHDYIEGGIPLVNPTHIKKGKIVPDNELTVSEEKYLELSNYYLQTGDTIMGRRGEMARCALVTDKENGWLCGTGSLYVRPNLLLIEGFVAWLCRVPLDRFRHSQFGESV